MNGPPSVAAAPDPKTPNTLPDGAVSLEKTAAGDVFFIDVSGARLRQLDAAETAAILVMGQAGNDAPEPRAVIEVANNSRGSMPVTADAAWALSASGAQQTQARPRTAATQSTVVTQPVAPTPVTAPAAVTADPAAAVPQPPVVPASADEQAFLDQLGAAVAADPLRMDAASFPLPRPNISLDGSPEALQRAKDEAIGKISDARLATGQEINLSQQVYAARTVTDFEEVYANLQAAIQARAQTAPQSARVVPLGPPPPGQPVVDPDPAAAAAPGMVPPPPPPTVRVRAPAVAIAGATPRPAAAATPAAAPVPPGPATPAAAPGAPAASLDAAAVEQMLDQRFSRIQQEIQALSAQLAAAAPPAPPTPPAGGGPGVPPAAPTPPAAPATPAFVAPIKSQGPEPIGFVPSDPQPERAWGIVGQDKVHGWWVKSPNGAHFQYRTAEDAIAASLQMNGTGGVVAVAPLTPATPVLTPLSGDPATQVDQLIAQSEQAQNALNGTIVTPLTQAELDQLADPNLSPAERAVLQGRRDARARFEQQFMSAEHQLDRIRGALAQQGTAVLAAAPTPAVAAQAARGVRSIRQILAGEQNRLGTLKYIFNMQNAYVIAAGAAAGAAVTGLAVATGGAAIPVMYAAMAAGGVSGFARTFAEKRRAKQVLLDAAGRETDARRENLLREEANALSVRDNLGTLVFNTMLGGAAGGAMNRVLEWTGARDFVATWWAGTGPSGRNAAVAGATVGGVAAPARGVPGIVVGPARPITVVPLAPRGPSAALVSAPRPRVLSAGEWIMAKRGELIIPGYGRPQQCGIDVHGRKVLAQLGNGSTVLDTITKERSWGTPRCLAALRGQFDIAFRHPSGPRMAGIFVENYQGRTAERAVVPGAVVDTLSTVRGRATTLVPGVDMTPSRPPVTLAEGLARPRPTTILADAVPGGIRSPGALRDAAQVLIGTNSPDPLGRLMARAGIDGYATELLFKGDAPLKGIVGRGRLELIDTIRGILTRDPNLVKEMFPGHPNPVSLIRSGDITFTTGGRMNMNVFKNQQFIEALVRALEQSKQGVLPASITTDFGGNYRTFAETVSRLLSESPRPRLTTV